MVRLLASTRLFSPTWLNGLLRGRVTCTGLIHPPRWTILPLLLRLHHHVRSTCAAFHNMEAATVVLISTVFAIPPHIFPWYTTALLPRIAMLAGPLWMGKSMSGKGL